MQREKRAMILIISGPSGVGKSTIVDKLLKRDMLVHLSISFTTRDPRAGEIDGEHYHFITHDRFDQLLKNGEILEYTKVTNNYYGTAKKDVDHHLASGKDLIFCINSDGYYKMLDLYPKETIGIFILPPSKEILMNRLYQRMNHTKETESQISERCSIIDQDLLHYNRYHYSIINDELEEAIDRLCNIIQSERMTRYKDYESNKE